jgi:hypothetical protein
MTTINHAPPAPAFIDSWETLILKLAEASDARKQWEAYEKQYKQALVELWERGEAPTEMVTSNHKAKVQQGRVTFTPKKEFKKQFDADKDTLQKTYLDADMAEMVQGAPFIVLKELK